MKKLQSTLPNMVVVLTAVAVISGAVLASVNHATEAPIKAQGEKTLAEGIKNVMATKDLQVAWEDTIRLDINGKEQAFVVHHVNDAQGNALGAAVESTTMGFGGDLKVLVGFSGDDKILGYTVLQHAETPGLGAKADVWFKNEAAPASNIVGRVMDAAKPLTVSKDGGEINAITASTITSRAFLNAVNQAYAAYKQKGADAQTAATGQEKNK
ncbi:MAG: RnfABCDGE type electron transport complex subunit G [Prevotella sp.]|nr:RnfABCDGE type electron transport complex subunit G [Prevotella sp.]